MKKKKNCFWEKISGSYPHNHRILSVLYKNARKYD
eukprot:SAG11_NODE_40264_length_206_cov_12.028037_1_plen_34_part_01